MVSLDMLILAVLFLSLNLIVNSCDPKWSASALVPKQSNVNALDAPGIIVIITETVKAKYFMSAPPFGQNIL